jgi:hypothetical protein
VIRLSGIFSLLLPIVAFSQQSAIPDRYDNINHTPAVQKITPGMHAESRRALLVNQNTGNHKTAQLIKSQPPFLYKTKPNGLFFTEDQTKFRGATYN